MSVFKKYGAAIILFALWASNAWLYYHFKRLESIDQARDHGQNWSESDFHHSFWAGMFENTQSEWAQLFVQSILLLSPLAYLVWAVSQQADKKDVDKIIAEIRSLKEHR